MKLKDYEWAAAPIAEFSKYEEYEFVCYIGDDEDMSPYFLIAKKKEGAKT